MEDNYWDEDFKIRVTNYKESFQKKEIIKLLLVMKLIKSKKCGGRDSNSRKH